MVSRLREVFLGIAVLGLVVTAAIQPNLRYLSLLFAVVGTGLLIRRRQRRLAARRTDPTKPD